MKDKVIHPCPCRMSLVSEWGFCVCVWNVQMIVISKSLMGHNCHLNKGIKRYSLP